MSFDNLSRVPRKLQVDLPRDEEGYVGRECPVDSCVGYFKIKPGTGLKGSSLPCRCPYCGHTAANDQFATKEQVEYVKSIAHSQVVEALRKDLKSLEFDIRPKGPFGIGVSMKLQPGTPIPLKRYRERELETHVTCVQCTLDYSVYGVFAFCPDCGVHNSVQILEKNLALVRKQLALAVVQQDEDLVRHLIEDALENCVSSFDGFGRELCRIHASTAQNPVHAVSISFQNLARADTRVRQAFSVSLLLGLSPGDIATAQRGFMRRHVLAHRGGVVDQQYLDETNEPRTLLGRRLAISAREVEELADLLLQIGRTLTSQLASRTGAP